MSLDRRALSELGTEIQISTSVVSNHVVRHPFHLLPLQAMVLWGWMHYAGHHCFCKRAAICAVLLHWGCGSIILYASSAVEVVCQVVLRLHNPLRPSLSSTDTYTRCCRECIRSLRHDLRLDMHSTLMVLKAMVQKFLQGGSHDAGARILRAPTPPVGILGGSKCRCGVTTRSMRRAT